MAWKAWVFPRACGGTLILPVSYQRGHGLSPRLRGNRHRPSWGVRPCRSIPAPAGEPGPACRRCIHNSGLSPRLRGNHVIEVPDGSALGSIPAPAGEPLTETPTPTTCGVYPRACGGTTPIPDSMAEQEGLSPRLRGNHHGAHPLLRNIRSIPAPAGEPLAALYFVSAKLTGRTAL